MPLPIQRSCTKKAFSKSVGKLLKEGKPIKQAVAISYAIGRKRGCKGLAQGTSTGPIDLVVYRDGKRLGQVEFNDNERGIALSSVHRALEAFVKKHGLRSPADEFEALAVGRGQSRLFSAHVADHRLVVAEVHAHRARRCDTCGGKGECRETGRLCPKCHGDGQCTPRSQGLGHARGSSHKLNKLQIEAFSEIVKNGRCEYNRSASEQVLLKHKLIAWDPAYLEAFRRPGTIPRDMRQFQLTDAGRDLAAKLGVVEGGHAKGAARAKPADAASAQRIRTAVARALHEVGISDNEPRDDDNEYCEAHEAVTWHPNHIKSYMANLGEKLTDAEAKAAAVEMKKAVEDYRVRCECWDCRHKGRSSGMARSKSKSFASKIASKRETLKLPKGLTRREAVAKARGRWKHDHRGFTYNPKTGVAVGT